MHSHNSSSQVSGDGNDENHRPPKKEKRKKQISVVADFMGVAEDADLKWEIKAMQTAKIRRPHWSLHEIHGGPSLWRMQDVLEQGMENVSSNKGTAFHGNFSSKFTDFDKERVMANLHNKNVFLPWSKAYKAWWFVTVVGAMVSFFFETFCIAFLPAGLPYRSSSAVIEYCLVAIFLGDILVNLNLAYYDEDGGVVVYDRRAIRRNYFKFIFWIDLIGIFPFYIIALAIAGQIGKDNSLTQYLALFRLSRLVRTYRIKRLFRMLQYSSRISFIWLTLIRNFVLAFMWSHAAACIMFFISRQFNFNDQTLLGSKQDISQLRTVDRYIVSMYWSIVTFSTVGYGDYAATYNEYEQIFSMIYVLLNIIIQAWMIGSITLLIVKGDGKTGVFRDTLKALHQYAKLNSFGTAFEKSLRAQLKLEFDNREVADEQVLKHFPSSVRSKVLRQLYLPFLLRTHLMKGVRQQFVDAFLEAVKVEIFTAGEEVVQHGSISANLYLLVGGTVKVMPMEDADVGGSKAHVGTDDHSTQFIENASPEKFINSGDFINETGFFTESPQLETICTVTVCKMLTMSRSAYNSIAGDHPGTVSKILNNLLDKVQDSTGRQNSVSDFNKSKAEDAVVAEYVHDDDPMPTFHNMDQGSVAAVQTQTPLAKIQYLVSSHINKLQDDYTTRFLHAASNGDVATLSLMCENGFDPDTADYDGRTALIVASMRGNLLVVKKLIECNANVNLKDLQGSTALLEATRCGHADTTEELLKVGARIFLNESKAAWSLCQAVFEGDVVLLRRLLQAGVDVDSSDYDKRTAAHVAAAEGNVAAMKVLVEFGADLTLEDRWHKTIDSEAVRSNSGPMLSFLETLAQQKSGYIPKDWQSVRESPTLMHAKDEDAERNVSDTTQQNPENCTSSKEQGPAAQHVNRRFVEGSYNDDADKDEHDCMDYDRLVREEENALRLMSALLSCKHSLDQTLVLLHGTDSNSAYSEVLMHNELLQKLSTSLHQASVDLVSYQSELFSRRLQKLTIVREAVDRHR